MSLATAVARWFVIGSLVLGEMALAGHPGAQGPTKVDRILVKKSARKMYLYKDGRVVRTYSVSLGKHPKGPKVQEGDARTPEGSYLIDWRNPNSRFFKSIHISYPNDEYRKRAEALGVSPGGEIMIHGLPNDVGPLVYAARGKDWTEGCIAVDNEAMDELWQIVDDQTPIDILP